MEMFVEWLRSLPETAGYQYSRGMWTESPGRKLAVWQEGGRIVGGSERVRYPSMRLVIVGNRDARSDATEIEKLAEVLIAKDYQFDCVHLRAIGGMIGPGYTTENRPWVELNFELVI
jgi:hypothetical protein